VRVGRLEDAGRDLWPFDGLPGLDEWVWCCHCGRMFVFSDALVMWRSVECRYEGCEGSPLDFFTRAERRLPDGQAPEYGVEVW
jgi:hypothetical protein